MMGLDGMVSKHRERAYRAGRIKVKNQAASAIRREIRSRFGLAVGPPK